MPSERPDPILRTLARASDSRIQLRKGQGNEPTRENNKVDQGTPGRSGESNIYISVYLSNSVGRPEG